jgi:large subunit ribosomal protein L19e
MNLKLQKTIAAKIAKRSPKKIRFNPERIPDIKEAITKTDVRSLIKDGAIFVNEDNGVSRVRARKRASQKRKGRQNGDGRKKGKKNTRLEPKLNWIIRVRAQREFIRTLKSRIDSNVFKNLLSKIKGGYFRSLRHIKLYITEHKLVKENEK